MVPTTLSGIHNFDRRKFLRTSALALAAAPFVLPSSGEARSATSRTLLVRSISGRGRGRKDRGRTAHSERWLLWYGLTWGAPFAGPITNPFDGLANTTTSAGKTIGVPFPLVLQSLGTWVQRNPPVPEGTWDWTTTTYPRFDQLFQRSVVMYGNVMGTDDPDLRAFKKSGGKLIMWPGLADQLIFTGGIDQLVQPRSAVDGRRDKQRDGLRAALPCARRDALWAIRSWARAGEPVRVCADVGMSCQGHASDGPGLAGLRSFGRA
jgi:hypothetical protein